MRYTTLVMAAAVAIGSAVWTGCDDHDRHEDTKKNTGSVTGGGPTPAPTTRPDRGSGNHGTSNSGDASGNAGAAGSGVNSAGSTGGGAGAGK